MSETLLSGQVLPSMVIWLSGFGAVIVVLLVLLLQRAARDWMFCERTQEMRRHTARVEAGWRQAM